MKSNTIFKIRNRGLQFTFLIIASITLIFFSCKDSSTESVDPLKKSFINPYNNVGKVHNEVVNQCLIELKKEVNSQMTADEILEKTKSIYHNYLNKNNMCQLDEVVDKTLERFGEERKLRLSKLNSELESLDYSQDQIYYFNRLFNLFDLALPIDVIKDSINAINIEINNKFNENDAKPLLITSSVMINSLEYWFDHKSELIDFASSLNNSSLKKTLMEIDWYQVGEVDAYAGMAALIPCIGSSVGYGVCVGGAAAGASILNLIIQIISLVF